MTATSELPPERTGGGNTFERSRAQDIFSQAHGLHFLGKGLGLGNRTDREGRLEIKIRIKIKAGALTRIILWTRETRGTLGRLETRHRCQGT